MSEIARPGPDRGRQLVEGTAVGYDEDTPASRTLFAMLFYRPLLLAYRSATIPEIRRFLLRELANPRLHCEPDETLASLRQSPDALDACPARLLTEMKVMERLVRLRLTTGDLAHEATSGLWTTIRQARTSQTAQFRTIRPGLPAAAGTVMGPAAQELLRLSTGANRAIMLASLGDLGGAMALPVLSGELLSGSLPGAAAVGLARLGTEEAAAALFSGVQARGLPSTAGWLGSTLAELAFASTVPLLNRTVRAHEARIREEAAIALESFGPFGVGDLLEIFSSRDEPWVRLNLLRSIGRLAADGSVHAIRKFHHPDDADIIRTTAIQAAGRVGDDEAREFLEKTLQSDNTSERAEALEALIARGESREGYVSIALEASRSEHKRLALNGLLALVVWDPERAFDRVVEMLKSPYGAPWYMAAYALRYLSSAHTVKLLGHLQRRARGNDLEELVASALGRHLHETPVLDTLLEMIRPETSPVIVDRIVADLVRQLPLHRAREAAVAFAAKLDLPFDARVKETLLTALGAFGIANDLVVIVSHAKTEPLGAIRAMELVRDPMAMDVLRKLAAGGTPEVRAAASTALFRLGELAAVDRLVDLAGSSVDDAVAGFQAMALSVRAMSQLPRLDLLRKALEELAGIKDSPHAGPQEGEPARLTSGVHARAATFDPRNASVQKTLAALRAVGPRPAVDDLPDVRPGPQRSSVYQDLGEHLVGPTRKKGAIWLVVATAAALAMAVFLVKQMQRSSWMGPKPPRVTTPSTVLADPSGKPLRPGQLVTGSTTQPALLKARLKDNWVRVEGRLRVKVLETSRIDPSSFTLSADLEDGTAQVSVPGGRSRVFLTSHATVVEAGPGVSRVTAEKDRMVVRVESGSARVNRDGGDPIEVPAGQQADFARGALVGKVRPIER